MLLYAIPGGRWAGSEKDWKAGLKLVGLDPKDMARKQVDVPTNKAGLMEFLTFHGVDPLGGTATTMPVVDVAALQREHNPDAAPPAPPTPAVTRPGSDDLAALFAAAPANVQAELVVGFIDRLTAKL